jgi:hypothetical protein
MIVTAYAAGDRKQLKSLLGKEVYDGFENAIKEREQKGETVETRFVASTAPTSRPPSSAAGPRSSRCASGPSSSP